MKKSLLAMLFAVALAVPALADGMWIGGNLGYNHYKHYGDNSSSSSNSTVDTTEKSFSIAPELGFNVSEKWDLGVSVGFTYQEASAASVSEYDRDSTSRNMAISPFVRYKVFSMGDFSVLAKGSLSYQYGNRTYNGAAENAIDRAYGISIAPVVEYAINDTWSIGATLNFASLSYWHSESQFANGLQSKTDNFGFNANNGEIVNINFSYHF